MCNIALLLLDANNPLGLRSSTGPQEVICAPAANRGAHKADDSVITMDGNNPYGGIPGTTDAGTRFNSEVKSLTVDQKDELARTLIHIRNQINNRTTSSMASYEIVDRGNGPVGVIQAHIPGSAQAVILVDPFEDSGEFEVPDEEEKDEIANYILAGVGHKLLSSSSPIQHGK